jgi:hypothetical protein
MVKTGLTLRRFERISGASVILAKLDVACSPQLMT